MTFSLKSVTCTATTRLSQSLDAAAISSTFLRITVTGTE